MQMGSCFSSDSSSFTFSIPTAKVISIKGDLHEYPIPITAAQVLQSETTDIPSSFFICNSDKLYFDAYIPPLDSTELLQPNQIYFILPIARLQYPLTYSDMGALAVKASSAALLDCSNKMTGRRWSRRSKKIRVLPHLVDENNPSDGGDGDLDVAFKRFENAASSGMGLSRSGSVTVRKLQRNASSRGKKVYRSFRMRLSTIYENEGSVAAVAA